MGTRGPAKKPTALVSKVNRSKRGSSLDDSIKPDIAVPDCPDFLSASAKNEWMRITPHLVKLGLLSQLDMAALALYCDAYGRFADLNRGFEKLVEKIQATENVDYCDALRIALIDVTPNGYKQVSALSSTIRRYSEDCLRYLAQFGLSPSARARVQVDVKQLASPGIEPAAQSTPTGWTGLNSFSIN